MTTAANEIQKILVRRDDIMNHAYDNNENCAIAVALKRKFKTDDVRVAGYDFKLNGVKYKFVNDSENRIVDMYRNKWNGKADKIKGLYIYYKQVK